jgi:hypothetical protein
VRKRGKIPMILSPGRTISTIQTKPIFKTKVIRPKVKIFKGKIIRLKTGLTKRLIRANKMPAKMKI